MPVPARCRRRGCPDPGGDSLAKAAEDPQGEPLPRGAVDAVREVPLAEVDGVLTGGVAVEDLKEEQVDSSHRVEEPVAPGVFFLITCLLDRVGGKFGGQVLSEAAQDEDHTWRHGRAPSQSGWLCSTTRLPEVPPVLKSLQTVQ